MDPPESSSAAGVPLPIGPPQPTQHQFNTPTNHHNHHLPPLVHPQYRLLTPSSVLTPAQSQAQHNMSPAAVEIHLFARRFVDLPFRRSQVLPDNLRNSYFVSVAGGTISDEEAVCHFFTYHGFALRIFGSAAALLQHHPEGHGRIEPADPQWIRAGHQIDPTTMPPLPTRPCHAADAVSVVGVDSSYHPVSSTSTGVSNASTDSSHYHGSYHPMTMNTLPPDASGVYQHPLPSMGAPHVNASPQQHPMPPMGAPHVHASPHHHPTSVHIAPSPVNASAPPAAAVPSVSAMTSVSFPPSFDEGSVGALTSAQENGTSSAFNLERVHLPVFKGADFIAFLNDVTHLMETPHLNPGGKGELYERLVTTSANATQSRNLRQVLLKFTSGAPRDIFTNRNEFIDKGFEMLARLCTRYAPQTPAARFLIYVELLQTKQFEDEAVETYCARLRQTSARLHAAGVVLDPMLLTMIAMYGLNAQFDTLRNRFAEDSAKYANATLDDIEQEASDYLRVAQTFEPSVTVHASAAGTGGDSPPSGGTGGGGGGSSGAPEYPKPRTLQAVLNAGTIEGSRKVCGYCKRTNHHTPQCHILTNYFASHGYVLVKDEDAAKVICDNAKTAAANLKAKKSESPSPSNTEPPVAAASVTTANPPTDPLPTPRPPTPPPQTRAPADDDDTCSFNSFSDGSVGSFFIHEESAVEVSASSASVAINHGGSSSLVDCSSCSLTHKEAPVRYTVPFPAGDRRNALRGFLSQNSSSISYHMSASAVTKMVQASADVCIADSGATDHLFPHYEAFISYHRVTGRFVRLADKRLAKIMGVGSVAVLLGGKKVVLHNVYHVPALRAPLFSLRSHRQQPQCGFIGDNATFSVWFPTFSLEVDDSVDSYLSFSVLGRNADLRSMDYVQPKLGRTPVAASSASCLRRSRRLQERNATATLRSDPASPSDTSAPTHPPTHQPTLPPTATSPTDPPPTDPTAPLPEPSSPADAPTMPSHPSSSSTSPTTPILKSTVTWGTWKEDVTYHIPLRKCPSTWKLPPPPSPLSIPSDTHRRISPEELLLFSTNPHASPPPVRPCDTPNESDSLQHLTSDQIYKLFGNRRFRDYESFCSASKDCTFIKGGQPIPSIGEFATMRKRKRGKTRAPTPHFLDLVHMDIVYGEVISRLGYRFALLLVDRATKYIWIYGLRHLTSANIIEALELFQADAGALPREFRCDCDQKLLGGETRRWIIKNKSTIHGAPAGRQSANGLVERYWQTLCSMARAYLVEKQMSRDYWFFAVQHAARMHNMIPGRVNGRLTTPFELVHRCPPDTRTWFPIFSMVYFYKDSDADKSRSTFQSNAMQGIAVGRSSSTNGLLVYHPGTKKYYEPDTYKFDPSRLPCNEWPNRNLQYDGGLVASLYRDSHSNVPEPYPPGMPFQVPLPNGSTTTAIVSSLPFRDANGAPVPDCYRLQCPDGSLLQKTLLEMDELAESPANRTAKQRTAPDLPAVASLPIWLQHGSKVTFDKDGEFHKGFIIMTSAGVPRFSCRRQMSSREESWGVDLPNLLTEWPILAQDNILIPSWTYSTFLRPASEHMHINVSHVSAIHLKESCPASLRQALASSHPDRDTWLESYYEEKQALVDNETYVKLSLEEYRRLRRKGANKAIPSMCVLVVKPDENLNPHRAKSRIVVLGNQDDRPWSKGDKYAPVLQYSSLRLLTSMAVEKRRRLQQGDAKNAFCQGTLPADETTIIKPPPGDPDAAPDEYWLLKKCLYGLARSPRHWFDLISSTLRDMGMQPSSHDPCLWIGHPSDKSDTSSASTSTTTSTTEPPLHLGIYVDDFVYFSESDEVERRFERLLASKIKVDFMGTVNWFLGSHFEWADHADGALSVHISQSAYAQHLVERYKLDSSNYNPHATPYRSGCPIDSIPPANIDELDKWFVQRRDNYRSLIGGLTWLATNTRPDLAPVVSFLASYNSCPAAQHWEAAKYVVRYLRSTVDHGIAYHSASSSDTSAYVHFPFPHDKEAYSDAVKPAKDDMHELSAYTDACWGSQLGNTVPDGDEVEMWKFRSMSGFIVMRCGGPIAWKSVRQDRCSRSSCEAEIRATDEGIKEVLSLRARCADMSLTDANRPTPVYNDNQGCVDWSKTTSTKGLRHLNIRDCAVRDSIQAEEVSIHHIQGVINPADIFTKEMKDGLHFRTLRDSFMMSHEAFRAFVRESQVQVSASWVSGITLTCL